MKHNGFTEATTAIRRSASREHRPALRILRIFKSRLPMITVAIEDIIKLWNTMSPLSSYYSDYVSPTSQTILFSNLVSLKYGWHIAFSSTTHWHLHVTETCAAEWGFSLNFTFSSFKMNSSKQYLRQTVTTNMTMLGCRSEFRPGSLKPLSVKVHGHSQLV